MTSFDFEEDVERSCINCGHCFDDCLNGKIKTDCPDCSGTGEGRNEHEVCYTCHGSGIRKAECIDFSEWEADNDNN